MPSGIGDRQRGSDRRDPSLREPSRRASPVLPASAGSSHRGFGSAVGHAGRVRASADMRRPVAGRPALGRDLETTIAALCATPR